MRHLWPRLAPHTRYLMAYQRIATDGMQKIWAIILAITQRELVVDEYKLLREILDIQHSWEFFV